MTDTEFFQALDARIAERDLLQHPFYRMWTEGTLPMSALQGYAGQYWQQVWSFPTWLSTLHARSQDKELRSEVARNLAEEEGAETTHPELWLRFAEGIGASRAEVEAARPLPETKGCLETFRYLAEEGRWSEAVAAFYAHESQVPRVAEAKVEGLRENYDVVDPETLEYFQLHAEMDKEHAAAWRRLLAAGCTDEISRKDAVEAAGRAADALWRLLDGVHREYVGAEAAAC